MRRILTIISLIINSIFLVLCSVGVFNILSPVLEPQSIGLIGGNDGPTAIYVSSDYSVLSPLAITVLFCILLLFEITFILNLGSNKPRE